MDEQYPTQTLDKETVEGINDRWKHRRMMAWCSMLFLNIIAMTSILFPEQVHEANGILMAVVTAFTSIVVGYTGFATYDDIRNRDVGSGMG